MKKYFVPTVLILSIIIFYSCGNDSEVTPDDDTNGNGNAVATPVSAFDDFNIEAVTVAFDNDEITITSNALPNHTSPYWSNNAP